MTTVIGKVTVCKCPWILLPNAAYASPLELPLGVAFTHTLRAATPALYRPQDPVDILRTTPLLMRQDINAQFFLPLLHKVDISQHPILFKLLAQLIRDDSSAMQSSKRNKLQNKPMLGDVPDE